MTTTPDADRQARRKHLADLILRMRRGELHSQGRDILAAVLKDEQADADQAREQLAAARAGDGNVRTASDVLVQHDVTRKALCDALGVGYHLNWQQLVDTAQRHHDANAEWQAEAEQHRHALADALGGMDADTPWDGLIRRATQVLAGRHRAFDMAREIEADRDRLANDRQAAEDGRVAADNMLRAVCAALGVGPDTDPVIKAREILARAARAERDLADMHAAESADAAAGSYAERAEKAEAAITRVRRVAGWAANSWTDLSPEKVLAALGDPQPATAPDADRTVAYRNVIRRGALLCRDDGNNLQGSIPLTSEDLPDGGICTECGADVLIKPEVLAAACGPEAQWDAAAPGREQPTEPPPTISVIDQVAAALIAASRYLRGDTP